jgi:hypothetical protein
MKFSEVDFRENASYDKIDHSDVSLRHLIGAPVNYNHWASDTVEPSEVACAAVFGLSVGLSKFPAEIDLKELVKNGAFNMLGIYNFNYERYIFGDFCSEGLLNGLASFLLYQFDRKYCRIFVDWVLRKSPPFLSIREIGEIVERFFLIKASKACTQHFDEYIKERSVKKEEATSYRNPDFFSRFIYQPIGMKDFMAAFLGMTHANDFFESYPVLKKAFIAFNHFVVMSHDFVERDPYGAMAKYLARGAALVTPPNTNGVHIMIPMVLYGDDEMVEKSKTEKAAKKPKVQEKSRLSFVYIHLQVGRRFEKLPTQEEVAKSSPHVTFAEHFGEGKANTPYCYIYHHLCAGAMKCKVISQLPGSESHFPCIAVQGVSDERHILSDLISNGIIEPSIEEYPHLRVVGTLPDDSGMSIEESDQSFASWISSVSTDRY